MIEVSTIEDTTTEIEKLNFRKNILLFEKGMAECPDVIFGDSDVLPLKHTFVDGQYIREIFIPKGKLLTGKIHFTEYSVFFMAGKILIATESGGREIVEAPKHIISPAGTKRLGYAIEDCVWIETYPNPNNITDLQELENLLIAPTYEAYEQNKNKNAFKKVVKIDEEAIKLLA